MKQITALFKKEKRNWLASLKKNTSVIEFEKMCFTYIRLQTPIHITQYVWGNNLTHSTKTCFKPLIPLRVKWGHVHSLSLSYWLNVVSLVWRSGCRFGARISGKQVYVLFDLWAIVSPSPVKRQTMQISFTEPCATIVFFIFNIPSRTLPTSECNYVRL